MALQEWFLSERSHFRHNRFQNVVMSTPQKMYHAERDRTDTQQRNRRQKSQGTGHLFAFQRRVIIAVGNSQKRKRCKTNERTTENEYSLKLFVLLKTITTNFNVKVGLPNRETLRPCCVRSCDIIVMSCYHVRPI